MDPGRTYDILVAGGGNAAFARGLGLAPPAGPLEALLPF